MPKTTLLIVAACVITITCGCKKSAPPPMPAPAAPARAAAALSSIPVELTAGQRSTTAVPGSDERLLLTIDDITRNQVMASLATDDGAVVLPARSMSPDDSAEFDFGDATYLLTLKNLNNALVGDDAATFVISTPLAEEESPSAIDPAETVQLTEEAKIEKLIAAVTALGDAKFIRNGSEYSAADAADHLRTKRRAAGDAIKSAQQFIDEVASKSSTSGEPYQIKMPNGTTIQAADYLTQQLRELNAAQ